MEKSSINFCLLFIYLSTFVLSSCGGGSSSTKDSTINQNSELALYQKSLLAYNNKEYNGAITLFTNQLDAFPSGSYSSNAHYYEGRSLYAINDFTSALSQFQIVLSQYSNSSFVDSAQYWSAKSNHKLGQFDVARKEYLKVAATSKWADNAAYQIGKTHYDQALLITDAKLAYLELNTAIKLLQDMISNPDYAGSTSFDDAQYYLGRSFQLQGNFLLTDNTLSTTVPVETALGQFASARIEFNKIESFSIFFDDAHYQLARIDYEIAKNSNIPADAYALYDTSISGFEAFLNDANVANSNRLDAVYYFLGRSFQEQGYLLLKDGKLNTIPATDKLLNARTQYALIPVDSIYYDDGLYFTGRSYHEEADYINAQLAYKLLIPLTNSSLADDAQYQLAKTYYDDAITTTDPALAVGLFSDAEAQFSLLKSNFTNSNRLDSALYYEGRSWHRHAVLTQADANLLDVSLTPPQTVSLLFGNARSTYQILVDTDPTSTWADNALFQQGDSFYDEAVFAFTIADLANDTIGQEALNQAIGKWNLLLNDAVYKKSNSADNAQYSLGRANQLVLPVPTANRITITGIDGVDFKLVDNTTAITEYNNLITRFDKSNWIDNAHYNIGVIHNNDALSAVGKAKEIPFDKALNSFNIVVTQYPSQNLADNAINKIATIYHDAGPGTSYCTAEQGWFEYLLTKTKDTLLQDNANVHINDLILLPTPVNHDCVSPETLRITVLTVPKI